MVIDKQVEVHRAQDTAGQAVASAMLIIGDPIPDLRSPNGPSSLEKLRKVFTADADLVFSALKSLPGGTLDALLVRLLEEKRSYHVVAWDDRRDAGRERAGTLAREAETASGEVIRSALRFFVDLAETQRKGDRTCSDEALVGGKSVAGDVSWQPFLTWLNEQAP